MRFSTMTNRQVFSAGLALVAAAGSAALVAPTPAKAGVIPIDPNDCSHCEPQVVLPGGTVCNLVGCGFFSGPCLYFCKF